MCSIVGLLDKSGKNVSGKILDMLEQTSHGAQMDVVW